MSVTKEIDLSPYAEGDKDPDGGNGLVRDGKLFLPLNQAKSMKEILATPAQVAVIDVATDKVEKVIRMIVQRASVWSDIHRLLWMKPVTSISTRDLVRQ